MRLNRIVGVCLLAYATLSAAEIPENHVLWGEEGPPLSLQKRATSSSSPSKSSSTLSKTSSSSSTSSPSASSSKAADPNCSNGPFTRTCWSNGYSVATDFDTKWPTTGNTAHYNLELTSGTCNPDGHGDRPCQLFNHQYPGPVITANWGDTISVTLKNSLQANGTGIHWHGLRQLKTNPQDGVPGVTECPLAPGDTKTYTFKATQFGTTWYHSHFSAQYGEGAFGAMVINGPASSNYDVDLGPYLINDYYYETAWQIGVTSHNNLQLGKAPPTPDTFVINGTNKNSGGGGSYNQVKNLQKGKKYRLRLINASLDNSIKVSLDNHNFTVITNDLVPVKPYNASWVLLGIGQRYDVIFTANQAADNYWFRVEAATDCASANNYYGRSIFSYAGASGGTPNSQGSSAPAGCTDPKSVPWVKNSVDRSAFVSQARELDVDLTVAQTTTNQQNIVVWSVNLTGIDVEWDKPTSLYVKDHNTSYPSTYNLIELPKEGIWTYWIIQEPKGTKVPIPHPIHLHGHDFYILGQGTGVFDKDSSPDTMTYDNPPRRDVAFLPGGGWLALAFPTDNPGAWLMHCHIAWHVADGLAVQFLEGKDSMTLGDGAWDKTCSNWAKYQKTMPYSKMDSGLKMMMKE